MRIRLAIPDRHVSPDVLDAILEAQTRAAASQVRAGEAPDARELLARGARWRPEPWADEHFDLPSEIARRGWGDCDDWAPALAGSLRASGDDEGARAFAYRSGPNRYHVVVQLSDGRIVDPSLDAGMRSHPGIRGATTRSMAIAGQGGLAAIHDGRVWRARCDVPWPQRAAHVASIASSPEFASAVGSAAIGAQLVGAAIDSPLAQAAEDAASEALGVGDETGAQYGGAAGTAGGAAAASAVGLPPQLGAAIGEWLGRALGGALGDFARGYAGLQRGFFDPIEQSINELQRRVPLATTRAELDAISTACVQINDGLSKLQGRDGLSDWDRQHCADLGAQCAAIVASTGPALKKLQSTPPRTSPNAQFTQTYTLPSGGSIAWGRDGRSMLVRF